MATYRFKDHISGTTFNGVDFELKVNGVAKDLTGSVINLNVGGHVFSTATGELTITDASAGKFRFNQQNINLAPLRYTYTMDFIFTGNVRKQYLSGTWRIR